VTSMTTLPRLPRTHDSLIHDQHTYDEWHAALLPLGASSAMECEEGFGLYVEHQVNSDGTDEVRLHLPKLGVTAGLCRGGQPEPLGFGCEVERIATPSENPSDDDNEADDGQDGPTMPRARSWSRLARWLHRRSGSRLTRQRPPRGPSHDHRYR
jgi:hypothetical protein